MQGIQMVNWSKAKTSHFNDSWSVGICVHAAFNESQTCQAVASTNTDALVRIR